MFELHWSKLCNLLTMLCVAAGLTLTAATASAQQTWNAKVGGQSANLAIQALAFLPNEIWIHAGDTITWTFESSEVHTVTFLQVEGGTGFGSAGTYGNCFGAPGNAPLSFDGSSCVSSDSVNGSTLGQTQSVTFPQAGNYEVVCQIHSGMFGTIHVLDPALPLPHDQAYYDGQAVQELKALLSDDDGAGRHGMGAMLMAQVIPHGTAVSAGVGEAMSTPGGPQGHALVRFLPGSITVHVGDTVEWANPDPIEGHTVTFGIAPGNLFAASCSFANSNQPCTIATDADGVGHASINSTQDNVHSGPLIALAANVFGEPQQPLPPAAFATRFRITFTAPGVYPYVCSFHDNLGMVGRVIVLP